MRKKALIILFIFFLIGSAFAEDVKSVKTLKVEGVINPVAASYIIRGIEEAEKDKSICVIQLDTPGGLDSSMRKINTKILNSSVPVVGYVYPEGSRAASAGVYILYACHFAAMSPSTNLGAAHPVVLSQGDQKPDKVMQAKMTNDAAAYIKSLADKRLRNAQWAEKAVRESVSITASEAKKLNVINFVAKNMDDLISQLQNKEVKIDDKIVVLKLTSEHKQVKMSFMEKFLHVITDPNIAYILMLLGIYGLIYEFASPGAIFPGVLGGISLILGLYALGTLPINYAGLFLIGLAVILFVVEVFSATHGLLAFGGIIAFVLGSLMLIPAGHPYLSISRSLIFSTAFITAAFFGVIVFLISKNLRKRTKQSGKDELIGACGQTRTPLNPKGLIMLVGELWTAESLTGEEISVGAEVIVREIRGLRVFVEKYKG
ncbi:MAG: nodulation protein NfeD [Armatimonadota bacterium]